MGNPKPKGKNWISIKVVLAARTERTHARMESRLTRESILYTGEGRAGTKSGVSKLRS